MAATSVMISTTTIISTSVNPRERTLRISRLAAKGMKMKENVRMTR
jgi:hypothetical protein